MIGLIIDKNLTNVFTLTYPFQFISGIIISIFGVGANVSAIKDKNKNSANNGILFGTITCFLIFGLPALNCRSYTNFMNMDVDIYYIFCTYSILQIMLQTILYLFLTKLHYLELNKKANKISLLFNVLNILSMVIVALITHNQFLSVVITLFVLFMFTIIIFIKNLGKIDFKLNIKNCFKYDSVSCSISFMFFIIYLFGFSNSFSYGEKYVIAITFANLITDIQWDMMDAIKTTAKIDISKGKFNYDEHFKNALKYISMIIISVLLMGLIAYPIYKPSLVLISIFVSLHIIDFIITSFTNIKMCYLEIEYSATKTTLNAIIAFIIRTIIIFTPTPFCTIIGQMCSSIYELIYATIVYGGLKKKKV